VAAIIKAQWSSMRRRSQKRRGGGVSALAHIDGELDGGEKEGCGVPGWRRCGHGRRRGAGGRRRS
jgi:hypothetical protein